MQRASILASSYSSISSYSTLRRSCRRGAQLAFPSSSSASSSSRGRHPPQGTPTTSTMRHFSSTMNGGGRPSKDGTARPSKKRFNSVASRALVGAATASTSYAAYYAATALILGTSIAAVNADVGADGAKLYSVEKKRDDAYGIEYVGFDSYPGVHLDDGSGVATEEVKLASSEVVLKALENAGLDERGMHRDIAGDTGYTIHPDHGHRNGLGTCPPYGCPLLPLDVHYEEEVKSQLENLRKREPEPVDDGKKYLLNSSGSDTAATLTLIGYKGGALERQVNQDRALALVPYLYHKINSSANGMTEKPVARLIGAFDGHANLGEKVSEYVAKTLPALLGSKLAEYDAKSSKDSDDKKDDQKRDNDIGKILHDTFLELDATSPAKPSGGCTASVVLQLGTKVYVANAGDSRSFVAVHVAGKDDDNNKPFTKIIFGTREDKPHLSTERDRVEKMGGTVYLPNGFLESGKGTTRVLYKDPTTGSTSGLAMSRSIGDWDAGEVGVIPDPLIDILDINDIKKRVVDSLNAACDDETDEVEIDPATGESSSSKVECVTYTEKDVRVFAVSATDGLLDYLPEQAIVNHVAKGLYDTNNGNAGGESDEQQSSHPLLACEDLIYAAAQGWQEDKGGRYRDDIAISITDLEVEE